MASFVNVLVKFEGVFYVLSKGYTIVLICTALFLMYPLFYFIFNYFLFNSILGVFIVLNIHCHKFNFLLFLTPACLFIQYRVFCCCVLVFVLKHFG